MARRTIHGIRGILTGASSGIGCALTEQLVDEGARLVLVARRAERLEDLKARLASCQGSVLLLRGDIADSHVRSEAVRLAVDTWGGLDLVINNAGIGAMGDFADATPERLRQVMEVNFFAAAELIRSALPHLLESDRPIVVNVGSVLGHRGVPGCVEYCASKFALEGFSQALRAELAPQKIDVLAVSPSRTRTEFFDRAINAQPKPWPMLQGMTSEAVAKQILKAIRRGKQDLIISPGGKALVWASRLFPGVMNRATAVRARRLSKQKDMSPEQNSRPHDADGSAL